MTGRGAALMRCQSVFSSRSSSTSPTTALHVQHNNSGTNIRESKEAGNATCKQQA